MLNQIFNLTRLNLVRLRVYGIIDAFNMLIDDDGISLSGWEKKLRKSDEPDLEEWLLWAESLPFDNKIFVDCTASEAVAKKYLKIAKAGFNIVTPNKKFNTFSMKEYRQLRNIMRKTGKQFLYETNVGAGLPVISVLQDLLKTGDKIVKIEGVFSGTLSYIFNNFDGKRRFSEIVATAKKLGYTEPDPREDLNGNDVGRKLLVLAREAGLNMEMENVAIQNLVPKELRNKMALEEFLKKLKSYDEYFENLLNKARTKNKVLRYVAKFQQGKASAKLEEISLDNPLASTKDADNIFAFYTKRYNKRPLVVQGPGAGAEVTATGVLADILKVQSL